MILFFVAAGWPATLLSGGNELGRGLAILAVALALLAGMTERPSRLALIATAAVLGGALALSSSPAVAKSAFLDWQHWDFYTQPQKAVSVSYIWDGRYDGVRFPKKKTTVLTIQAPQTPYYWRATVLERFDGTRWLEDVRPESIQQKRRLNPAPRNSPISPSGGHRCRARGQPCHWREHAGLPTSLGRPRPTRDRVLLYRDGEVGGLQRGQQYAVSSYAPRPTSEGSSQLRPSYPRVRLTRPGREPGPLTRGVTAPPFGEIYGTRQLGS